MGKRYKDGRATILAKMWETGPSHNLTPVPSLQKRRWQWVWKWKVNVYLDQTIPLLGTEPTEIVSEYTDICSEMFFAPLSIKSDQSAQAEKQTPLHKDGNSSIN